LNPSKEDNILSICGSGDQAFLMVEKGAKVLAVDKNKLQIEYSQLRLKSLFKKDFEDFVIPKNNQFYSPLTYKDSWGEYSKKLNLQNLIKNRKNINFLQGDIFNPGVNLSKFNKIYLSNSVEHSVFVDNHLENDFFGKFNSGSRVYCVMHDSFNELFKNFKIPLLNSGFKRNISFPKNYGKDDTWNYFIYEKK